MRMFSTFAALEQVVATGIEECRAQNRPDQWCFVIAYDGIDEPRPVWGYLIYDGYLQRCSLNPSP
jgi:hypothetical protein